MIADANRRDGSQIGRLTASAGIFNPEEIACVEELWDSYLDEGEASGYAFLVYRDGEGRVLGYASYGPHPLTTGTFDLYWIAVDPKMRGRGIAHALLSQVEDDVRARGGRLVVVETSGTAAYAPARRFYQSCGYLREAAVHDFYAPSDDLVIYTRRL